MQLLDKKGLLNSSYDVLDIGCGAAAYSIAVAGCVKTVTGIDISSKMIEKGKKRANKLNYKNIKLYTGDWNQSALAKKGFEASFDLVFAHMTPAVSNAAALEKMLAAGKHYYILCKPVRRNDPVYLEIEKLLGIERGNQRLMME